MNILIINHYAGSPGHGMEYRSYYLAREWVKSGHKVMIVAATNSHLRTMQPEPSPDLTPEDIDGISYLWLKTPAYYGSGFKRIVNMLWFVAKLQLHAKKIAGMFMPNAVIASSTYPMDIYPARRIALRSGARLCFELHDMWPLSPMIIGGYPKYHPFIMAIQRAENYACRHSDCYLSLLGNAEDYLLEHGLDPGRFFYVPNGFSEEEYLQSQTAPPDLPAEHLNLLNRLKSQNKIVVGYTGGHNPSNALKALLEAALMMKENPHTAFVLVGHGGDKEDLIHFAGTNQLENVHFLPPVPRQSIPALLSCFSLLYAGGVKSTLHHYGTSFNKITDYMLAAKPMIFSANDPYSLVVKAGCGVQVPAEDPQAIKTAVEHLAELPEHQRNELGDKGRIHALHQLSYTRIAGKIINIIQKIEPRQ